MQPNEKTVHRRRLEDWKVTIVDTGEETMTGGCLARVTNHVDDTFCFIYGDGVGDIEITHYLSSTNHMVSGRP